MESHQHHRQNIERMHAMIRGVGPDDHAERERLLWLLCGVHAGALTPVSEDEKRGMQRVLAILERKLGEGGGISGGEAGRAERHNAYYRARWTAFCEVAMMLRSALSTPPSDAKTSPEDGRETEAAWRAEVQKAINLIEGQKPLIALGVLEDILEQGREVWTAALRDVRAERRRQVEVEGWTSEHDDRHTDGSLAQAAACYASTHIPYSPDGMGQDLPSWPWEPQWWKPKDRRSDLVKAGALTIAEIERLIRSRSRILAEIERLDRLSTHTPNPPNAKEG